MIFREEIKASKPVQNVFKNICRLCQKGLKDRISVYFVYRNGSDRSTCTLADMIADIIGVPITKDDHRSKHVCCSCFTGILDYYQLKQTIVQNYLQAGSNKLLAEKNKFVQIRNTECEDDVIEIIEPPIDVLQPAKLEPEYKPVVNVRVKEVIFKNIYNEEPAQKQCDPLAYPEGVVMFECMAQFCKFPLFPTKEECSQHIEENHFSNATYIATTEKIDDLKLKSTPLIIIKRLESSNLPAIQKKLEAFALDIEIKEEKIDDETAAKYELVCTSCNLKAVQASGCSVQRHQSSKLHNFLKKYPEFLPMETKVIQYLCDRNDLYLFEIFKVYCDTCERSCLAEAYEEHTKSKLHRYYLTHPLEVPRYGFQEADKNNKLMCKQCRGIFPTIAKLKKHKLLHWKDPECIKFICDICDVGFSTKRKFRCHLVTKMHTMNTLEIKTAIEPADGSLSLKEPNESRVCPTSEQMISSKTRASERMSNVQRRKCGYCNQWVHTKKMAFHLVHACSGDRKCHRRSATIVNPNHFFECHACGKR